MTNDILSAIHDYGINPKTREIFLHGFIGGSSEETFGVDHRQAAIFQKNIRYLNFISDSPIVIHMCTSGGDWGFGMAIYDAIIASRSHVTIIAYGYAESMSGVILQAGDHRVISKNTEIMIHYGTLSVDADHRSVESTVSWNNILAKTMIRIFTERAKNAPFFKSYSQVQIENFFKKQIMQKGDWFLSTDEAIKYGIADCILDDKNNTLETIIAQ